MESNVQIANRALTQSQAAAGDTPACTDALTRSVGALPVVAARAMAEGQEAMHALSSKLQVRCKGYLVPGRSLDT